MSKSRQLYVILACSLMVLSSIVLFAAKGTGSDALTFDGDASRADPWDMLKPGTIITVGKNTTFNNSYYFPVPRGATVLDSRITISPLPLTTDGRDYPRNVSFNIGKGPREYYFEQKTGNYYTGDWGRQDRDMNGISSFKNLDLSTGDPHSYTFVLPKNATIDHAYFNITGHQRAKEFRNATLENPDESASHFATTLQVISDGTKYPLVLIGAPLENLDMGTVYRVQYNGSAFLYSTVASGPSTGSRFGQAISESIEVKSIGSSIAIGAPTEGIAKSGAVHLYQPGELIEWMEIDSFSGNDSNGNFGASLAVGNVDTDSDPELVVGAPTSLSGRGKVYVLDMVGSGGSFSEYTNLKTVLNGRVSDTNFGKSISIGDWNGDGREDLAVASDKEVRVLLGGSNMDFDVDMDPLSDTDMTEIATVVFLTSSTSSAREDLFIGCPDINGGNVAIYYGTPTPDPTVDKLVDAPSGAKDFGAAISKFRDMNGDGYNEVAIGAPGPLSSAGWVGIMNVRATTPSVMRNLPGLRNGDRFGAAVIASADLRADTYNDVLVGAPEFKGTTTIGNGYLRICEYYDISSLPSNTPTIRINGEEVWRYSGQYMRGSTLTLDIGAAFDQAIKDEGVFMSTPTDQFVGVDMVLDSLAQNNKEGSATFDLFDIDIRYTYNVELMTDIAKAFNSFMAANPESVQSDGTYHVPIEVSSMMPGKLYVFSFGIDLDLIPSMKSPITDLYMDEDTSVNELLDLRTVITDDRTSSVYLEFNVSTRGANASKVTAWILDDHWLAVTSPSKEEHKNWSGDVILILDAQDTTGGRFISPEIKLHVRSVNDPPAIREGPPTIVTQDNLYRFHFETFDAESDAVTFAVNGPENMTIDSTGTLTWTPSPWQVGDIGYELLVGDASAYRSYNFSVKVLNINDPPYFVSPAPNITGVYLGETFTYQIRAVDPDPGDTISYALDGPFGAVLGSETGLLVWTPEIFTLEPPTFTVSAFDQEGLRSDLVFNIRILVDDDPPRVVTIPIRNLYDSRPWYYLIEVSDPNDDVAVIDLLMGPEGMAFDKWTGNLSWTPSALQVGDFNVSLSIRSTTFVLYHNFTLTVSMSTRQWELRLTSHAQGATLKGKSKLVGIVSVEPGAVTLVQFSVDQGEWVNCTLSQAEGYWTHEFDTTKLKDGKHIIYLRASDGTSYSNDVAVEVNIKNEEEPFPFLLVLGVLVILLLVIGGAVLLFLSIRRRNLEKIKEEQARQQKEALTASRKEMDQFLTMTGHIDQGKDYTKMEVVNLDSCERSKEIDAIFQPLNIQKECVDDEPVEMPEDILSKARVSNIGPKEEDIPELEVEPPIDGQRTEQQEAP